jgi:gluconolactonase
MSPTLTSRPLAALVLLATACAANGPDAAPSAFAPPSRGEREVAVSAIPGIVPEGAAWSLVWQGNETADGMVAAPDGALWFAQEQTASIIALDPDDHEATVHMTDTDFAGSLSINTRGELFAVQRTCTDPGLPDDETCAVPTKVTMMAPERHPLAESFADGRRLGRLNDLAADSKGGVYFTVGGAYYASPEGVVSTVVEGEGVRTNGIILSPDERTLYVTNGPTVLAFDVQADGSTIGRRDFALLDAGDSGDGMTVDSEGRLYVTGVGLGTSLYVFDADGERLGVLPTPRQPVSIAFAGRDKRTLYLSAMGAVDPDGREHSTPDGVRNTAMSIYRIDLVSQGFAGRAK